MVAQPKVSSVEHAFHATHLWVNEVAREFDTDDRDFAYGVLRAWLHTLRDRLTVDAAAHFAAQLPDLIRGVFYENWDPSAVPVKYNAEEYAARFAHEANISVHDVAKAAAATTAAVGHFLPESLMAKTLGHLPGDVRALLHAQQ